MSTNHADRGCEAAGAGFPESLFLDRALSLRCGSEEAQESLAAALLRLPPPGAADLFRPSILWNGERRCARACELLRRAEAASRIGPVPPELWLLVRSEWLWIHKSRTARTFLEGLARDQGLADPAQSSVELQAAIPDQLLAVLDAKWLLVGQVAGWDRGSLEKQASRLDEWQPTAAEAPLVLVELHRAWLLASQQQGFKFSAATLRLTEKLLDRCAPETRRSLQDSLVLYLYAGLEGRVKGSTVSAVTPWVEHLERLAHAGHLTIELARLEALLLTVRARKGLSGQLDTWAPYLVDLGRALAFDPYCAPAAEDLGRLRTQVDALQVEAGKRGSTAVANLNLLLADPLEAAQAFPRSRAGHRIRAHVTKAVRREFVLRARLSWRGDECETKLAAFEEALRAASGFERDEERFADGEEFAAEVRRAAEARGIGADELPWAEVERALTEVPVPDLEAVVRALPGPPGSRPPVDDLTPLTRRGPHSQTAEPSTNPRKLVVASAWIMSGRLLTAKLVAAAGLAMFVHATTSEAIARVEASRRNTAFRELRMALDAGTDSEVIGVAKRFLALTQDAPLDGRRELASESLQAALLRRALTLGSAGDVAGARELLSSEDGPEGQGRSVSMGTGARTAASYEGR